MRDISILLRRVFLLIILVILITPYFQKKYEFVEIRPLSGAVAEPVSMQFSFKDWFSGRYQEHQEKYLNETFGFRNLLIRMNNQLAFNIFRKARANGVIVGKENYLYEVNYIAAYYGNDFIGADSIDHRMQRLKYIQDTLARLNKNIILVFAPGKGSYYPEYIPGRFKTEKKRTNYEAHLDLAGELNIPYIDFNKYFLENKTKSDHPLYPQYGIHWSFYGMCLAADSLLHFIEQERNVDLPNFYWTEVEYGQPREYDYDIARGMNIMRTLESYEMTYPKIGLESDSGKVKPSVLVISDSYYWGPFNIGISDAFTNSHFWYYNQQIYPDSYKASLEVDQVDLKEEIDRHDVFIIMATEASLPNLGWGFIENVYNSFRGTE